jgi:hypothetical protein
MKKLSTLLLLLTTLLACDKTLFEIEPGKVYTPSELMEKTSGKCKAPQRWEDKTVQVLGYIGQMQLNPPADGGKFWLHDGETRQVIEVYIQGATAEDVTQINALLKNNFRVVITGQTAVSYMPTQLQCIKGVKLIINKPEAIVPQPR